MARAPAPVAAEEVAVADDMAVADVAAAEEMAPEPMVVATILRNEDGTLVLEGPTPEIDPTLAAEGEAPAPAGETFADDEDGHGKLLTALMNLISGPGTPDQRQANFTEGYNGGPVAPPPAA